MPNGSAIDDLRMSGCLKLLFSASKDRVDGILINSSGGLTSGDDIKLRAHVGQASSMSITTQAAERAYRATDDPARVVTEISAGENATLFWLPQELILFEGAKLNRRLECNLTESTKALIVETLVFGRTTMGETLKNIAFQDRIRITRDGVPLIQDAIHIGGNAETHLARTAIAAGAGAVTTLIYTHVDAEARRAQIAPLLPSTAGISVLHDDVLVLRALAKDSMQLRKTVVPILDILTNNTLPTSWRL